MVNFVNLDGKEACNVNEPLWKHGIISWACVNEHSAALHSDKQRSRLYIWLSH